MVESKHLRQYLVLTSLLCGLAGILSVVSLFTSEWVTGSCRYVDQADNAKDSDFNYGLFGGSYTQTFSTILDVDISMTCSYSDNSCALLCAKNSDRRSEVLDQLINGEKTDWTLGECPQTSSLTHNGRGKNGITSNISDQNYNLEFINAYAYLFTIIFLVISACLGLLSSGLAAWNTVSNPIEIYFSIFGLYIYIGLASVFLVIPVVIWLVLFCATLRDYPAFILMIIGQMHPTSVSLGWSYWITLVAIVLYLASICTMYLRSYLISKEPKLRVEIEENKPAEILLF